MFGHSKFVSFEQVDIVGHDIFHEVEIIFGGGNRVGAGAGDFTDVIGVRQADDLRYRYRAHMSAMI